MIRGFLVMLAILVGACLASLLVAVLVWGVLRVFHVEQKDKNDG